MMVRVRSETFQGEKVSKERWRISIKVFKQQLVTTGTRTEDAVALRQQLEPSAEVSKP